MILSHLTEYSFVQHYANGRRSIAPEAREHSTKLFDYTCALIPYGLLNSRTITFTLRPIRFSTHVRLWSHVHFALHFSCLHICAYNARIQRDLRSAHIRKQRDECLFCSFDTHIHVQFLYTCTFLNDHDIVRHFGIQILNTYWTYTHTRSQDYNSTCK